MAFERVRTDDPEEEVARTMVHYGLLTVPVVDEDGRLKGAVSIGDVIDLVRPARLAWAAQAAAGGRA